MELVLCHFHDFIMHILIIIYPLISLSPITSPNPNNSFLISMAFWGWSCILLFALFCLCDPLSLTRIICGTTGLGAAHWSLGGSSVGTQVTAMTGRIPGNLSLICALLFRSHVPCKQSWLLWGHHSIPRHQHCSVLFCILYLNISNLFYNVA